MTRKELVKELEKLSCAFGPSGFEEEVDLAVSGLIRGGGKPAGPLELLNDSMNNMIMTIGSPGDIDEDKPVIMFDSHLDEVGFIVQSIRPDGLMRLLPLGSIHITNVPAHAVIVRTREGRKIRGIITSKAVHFLTPEESTAPLDMDKLFLDVGCTSREEAAEIYGIRPGDPVVPDVGFEYRPETGIAFGKAFDNRTGCLAVLETMKALAKTDPSKLTVTPVGSFSSQEEVGGRGAEVNAERVQPDLAIVFEGAPADDFFYPPDRAQGAMKGGAQIRHFDVSHINNPRFIDFAEKVCGQKKIRYQNSVRRGGGTDAGAISLRGGDVPTLVVSVPCRYVHTHYNFCALEDLESCIALALEVTKALRKEDIDRIMKTDLLQ